MDVKQPPPDDNLLAQQYPSPSADGQDTPFYDINHSSHQENHVMENPVHAIETDTSQQAPLIDSSMEASAHQEPQVHQQQEHLQQQHTEHKPEDANTDVAEELRLAAQLSQGLAPMMAEVANTSAGANPEAIPGHIPDGLPPQDHHMHAHHEETNIPNTEHIQAQEPLHQGHEAEVHAQDHNMHGMMSLPPHEQQPHQQQVHLYAEQGQQHQYQPQNPMHHMLAPDNTPPRKRSKASRACDECRRKKVKCDAVSESGDEACSNCRRSQITCLFSRIPQKRGPSKGYIKELADRINSIEGKLGGQSNAEAMDSTPRRESSDTFSPLNENAKRPFSSISREAIVYPQPETNRHAGWATKPFFTNSSLAPQAILPRTETPTQPASESQSDDMARASLQANQPIELSDAIFEGYLDIIHRVLPFLPGTKARLLADLSQCPPTLRDAFTFSLTATIQSFFPGSSKLDERKQAHRLFADWDSYRRGQESSLTDLVHLQTLLLLAIEADNHGPLALKGHHGGSPSKTELLGKATGKAYNMDLRNLEVEPIVDNDPEAESAGPIMLRAWWSLIALDRFNTIGTGNPLLVPQDTVVFSKGLLRLLGDGAYQFMKLAYMLGHGGAFLFNRPRAKPLPSDHCASFSHGNTASLEMWRLGLPDDMTSTTHPVVHLAYWHFRLLDYLIMPSAFATDIAWAAKETISMLTLNTDLNSPFNHNFITLAGLSLAELTKVEKTREDITNFLNTEYLNTEIAPSAWNVPVHEKVTDSLRPSTAQNLQQLADLATATGLAAASASTTATTAAAAVAVVDKAGEAAPQQNIYRVAENYEDMGFDPRPMLRAGYLNGVRVPA